MNNNQATGRFTRCFLFGHYDSRGGATLIRAQGITEALDAYARRFGGGGPDKTHRLFAEDFLGVVEAVFFGAEAPRENESEIDLDAAYGGDFHVGRVRIRSSLQSRWHDAPGQESRSVLVFWKGRKPDAKEACPDVGGPAIIETQIVKESLGEDAFGVLFVQA